MPVVFDDELDLLDKEVIVLPLDELDHYWRLLAEDELHEGHGLALSRGWWHLALNNLLHTLQKEDVARTRI